MPVRIKNCGMQDHGSMETAIESGASFIGFIHHPPSSRYVSFQHAAGLALTLPEHVDSVAVLVNPDDDMIREITELGYARYLQLHGDETPERVSTIKQLSGLPVIKAVGIETAFDLTQLPSYEAVADMLLLDTKHTDYGGTGESFDWSLLQGMQFSKPWFLSGGLNAENVRRALEQTHAQMVDVSSGIERERGVKDDARIRQFNQTVRDYESQ